MISVYAIELWIKINVPVSALTVCDLNQVDLVVLADSAMKRTYAERAKAPYNNLYCPRLSCGRNYLRENARQKIYSLNPSAKQTLLNQIAKYMSIKGSVGLTFISLTFGILRASRGWVS